MGAGWFVVTASASDDWFFGRERWSVFSSSAATFDTARYDSQKLSNSESRPVNV